MSDEPPSFDSNADSRVEQGLKPPLALSLDLQASQDFDRTIDQTLDFTVISTLSSGSLMTETATQATDSPFAPTESRRPERYQRLKSLGAGAMGAVDLARDQVLFRKVAYKHLKPELSQSAVFLNRFYKEAQITSQLEHPGIVPVYSMEQSGEGSLAYAMKWIRGQTLKAEIQSLCQQMQALRPADRLAQAQAEAAQRRLLGVFVRLAEAVDYAHSQGAVHRDLKPDNIMVGEYGEVYLLDWGVASLKGEQAQIAVAFQSVPGQSTLHPEQTQLGKLVGTPRYMSPEQARGEPGAEQASSDLYSLGLILYEICCLQPAYQASRLDELLGKVSQNKYQPPASITPCLPLSREWQAVIKHALGPTPAQRYAQVGDLLADVRAVLQDRPPAVLPDRLWQHALRWARRHPQASLLGMLLILLLAALMVISSLWLSQQALLQSRQRERAISTILTQRAQVSRSLDAYLSEMAALLEHLSARAIEAPLRSRALSLAESRQLPVVAGLADAVKSADSADSADLTSPLQSLRAPLALIQQAAVRVATTAAGSASPESASLSTAKSASPLQWSSIAYADGPQLIYPVSAAATFQDRFQAPPALQQDDAPHWTGLQSGLLTAYRALFAADRRYLGWAGIGLDPELVLAQMLPSTLAGLKAAYLVDAEGQVHLREGAAIALPPETWQQLQQRPSAYLEQGQTIWVRQPLGTLPWQLVWCIDWPVLLEAQHDAS